ncbi:hypothetical protein NW767_012529 [Fusarium falciforme]|uniref:Uncharacterized protein n=1 Tax=Fusarium falciforme TaxID=195108 RepID=A0A9W8UVM2_9HYPO|nr:hypothetical protein NW755_011514 [Fusarium falciforme]KAJ4186687.1 hypothetical protein NW767_012529 [Fusarium falciforme]
MVRTAWTVTSSGGAYVTTAYSDAMAKVFGPDTPYDDFRPVIPLVVHIELWEPGLELAVSDIDRLQPLIPDLDLGDAAKKKKQMPIDKAKMLSDLSALFVSELTNSLGPARMEMADLLWKI